MQIKTLAGGAVATALLLSGASLAFAQTTSGTGSYNPTAQVVPATPNAGTPAATATTGTTGTTSTGTTTKTPGVPNTGAGGDLAQNLAVLGASAAVALIGGTYLMRRRYAL